MPAYGIWRVTGFGIDSCMKHGFAWSHASSLIEYNLPAGFTEFRALAGLDDEILSTVPTAPTNATVRFMIFTNEPTGRTVEVTFASLGMDEPVLVRDLWLQHEAVCENADVRSEHQPGCVQPSKRTV